MSVPIEIETASPTDGFGPGPHLIAVVGARSVRATVSFAGEDEIEASIVARVELTADECGAVIAWCRTRWSAPARIKAFSIAFGA